MRALPRLSLAGALLVFCGCSADEPPSAGVTSATAQLDSTLQRDLTLYFTREFGTPATVGYEYLRTGPTVTGIAWPKFYVWVRAEATTGRPRAEGPARVALIDSTAEITHFFPHVPGSAVPATLDSVFPAPVLATIRARYWK